MSSTSTTWVVDTNTKSGGAQTFSTSISSLKILGEEGGDAVLRLFADEGDDNADHWRIVSSSSSNKLNFMSLYSGSWSSLLDLSGSSTAVAINQDSNAIALDIDSESTSTAIVNIDQATTTTGTGIAVTNLAALTTGSGLTVESTSTALATTADGGVVEFFHGADSDTNANNVLHVKNTHADSSGTMCLKLDQNANAIALDIDTEATTASTLVINSATTTTGYIIGLTNIAAMTTGSAIYVESNSSNTNLETGATGGLVKIEHNADSGSKVNNLLYIENDAAGSTATIPLRVKQDYDAGVCATFIGGRVGVGDATPPCKFYVTADGGDDGHVVQFDNSHGSIDNDDVILLLRFSGVADASNGHFIEFQDSDQAEMTGTIAVSSGTATNNSVSDYRIKENISLITGGLEKINALKPSYFNYKRYPDFQHQGFIAHEVVDAGIGYAITGEKDAMKIQKRKDHPDYGKEVKDIQMFAITNIIPQMVSAIQELSAKVTALENE